MSWCIWELLQPPFLLDSSSVTSVSSLVRLHSHHSLQLVCSLALTVFYVSVVVLETFYMDEWIE